MSNKYVTILFPSIKNNKKLTPLKLKLLKPKFYWSCKNIIDKCLFQPFSYVVTDFSNNQADTTFELEIC